MNKRNAIEKYTKSSFKNKFTTKLFQLVKF